MDEVDGAEHGDKDRHGVYTKSVNSEQSTTGAAAGATGELNTKTALSLGCKGEMYGRKCRRRYWKIVSLRGGITLRALC